MSLRFSFIIDFLSVGFIMMKSKFRVYAKITSLIFLALTIQAAASAELPPKIRAQKKQAIMRSLPNFTSKSLRERKFFDKNIMNSNDRASNLDPKFKKVVIIAGQKKERKLAIENHKLSEEIEEISSNFISSVDLRQNELRKLNSEA